MSTRVQHERGNLRSKIIRRMDGLSQWPGYAALAAGVILGLLFTWLPLQAAVVLLFGTAVILLILIQPLFGLALALLVGPFGALEQLFSGIASLDSGQLILLLTLISWIWGKLARRRIEFPRTYLNFPLLLFIIVVFISLLNAISIATGLKELFKWLEIAAIMVLVVDLGQKGARDDNGGLRRSLLGGSPRTTWIVGMLLLAGLSQALIGIWQFGLRNDGPEHFLVLGRFYRAYGTYEQPNPFGGFMNLSVLLALGILIGLAAAWWDWLRQGSKRANGSKRFTPGWRVLVLTVVISAIVVFTGAALIFSWSRGAWLGFGAGLAIMVLFWPQKRIYGAALLGATLLSILVAFGTDLLPEAVTARITSFTEDFTLGDVRGEDINDENYSVLERQAHWQAGLDMLRDEVALGVGFGNYGDAYDQYALINWPDALGHAHNYYINLLAEVGILGFAAYLLFWAAVLWQSICLLRKLAWPERGIVLGLFAVWVALAAHHLVDKLYVNNIYIHLGVMLGLLQLLDWYTAEEQGKVQKQQGSDFIRKSDFL